MWTHAVQILGVQGQLYFLFMCDESKNFNKIAWRYNEENFSPKKLIFQFV